jgi:hypothetical protein
MKWAVLCSKNEKKYLQHFGQVNQLRTQDFFRGGSTNSFEDRGQRKRGSGDGGPLVRGSTQFSNE